MASKEVLSDDERRLGVFMVDNVRKSMHFHCCRCDVDALALILDPDLSDFFLL